MKYIFCIIALLIQPVFSWYVYHKQDKKKAALKMPMLYYSVAYMVVQLYVFFKFCSKFPERYSIYSYLIQAAILLGFVIFEMILWGSNKYIEDVDNKEKQSIQDFKELIKDLEICRVNVQDTANKANIDKLYERMRYENPVSSPKAIEENLRIKGLIAELADITDNTLFEAKCNEIVKQLDIRKIKEFPKADIVLGGFPCPGFSEAGPRLVDDKRNFLYLHFIRCLMQSNPKIFVAENVKGMMTLGKGEVFKQIVQDFAAAGYTIYHKLLNSAEYGVPQIRERVILVGVRNDIDFEYVHPEPTHGYGIDGLKEVVTLRDAIGDLEDDPGDYFTGSYSTIFMSRNRKKLWSQPSFTIQASGRQAPIHPAGAPMEHVGKDRYVFSDGEENNRRLSVKEIARIQTFPDWYEFSRGTSNRNDNAKLDLVYKQIGNAVPVRLALAVAEPIAEFARTQLEQEKEDTKYVIVHETEKRMMA